MPEKETVKSRIWREEPEPDNPFAAAACFCHGYDVFGDMLGNSGLIEYLYLLFLGERPDHIRRKLLEDIAVAIANPGPRDHSVMAAMNGGVGGSNSAACLIAALAVGAGQYGGSREVALAMDIWVECGQDLESWKAQLTNRPVADRADVWPDIEHPPGFDPHGVSCQTPARQTLGHLADICPEGALGWLNDNRTTLESVADAPLAMTGVIAAALHDLGFNSRQGEMLHLILRLPGAAVHALEQSQYGFRQFPFFMNAIHLDDDPGPHPAPNNNGVDHERSR